MRRASYALAIVGMLSTASLEAQSAAEVCQGVVRTTLPQPPIQDSTEHPSSKELEPLIAALNTVQVVYLEGGTPVPDPVGERLRARLDTLAKRRPKFFRDALAEIIAQGLEGAYVPMVVNNAAARYRWEWGQADPLLRFIQTESSDRFLFPLSALTGGLSPEVEEFVFAVVCEVAQPLLVVRRTVSDSAYESMIHRLDWLSIAERILRHGERLLHGQRVADMQRLIVLIRPLTPVLDEKRFRRRPAPTK